MGVDKLHELEQRSYQDSREPWSSCGCFIIQAPNVIEQIQMQMQMQKSTEHIRSVSIDDVSPGDYVGQYFTSSSLGLGILDKSWMRKYTKDKKVF